MGQAIMLPLYFISGVFVPNASLPGWLRHLASIFPVQHLADGLHHAYDPAARGTGVVWGDLAVLGLWALAGLAVALRRFSWLPAARTG
jgi:ABC-2 type transport system permease protein